MDITDAMVILAAFSGALLSQPFIECVLRPLSNRRTHKRLMARDEFKAAWGRNAVSFFLRHGGFRRG